MLDESVQEKERKRGGDFECPICFEQLSTAKDVSATQCGHIFCTPCIQAALKEKKACPKCRKHLNAKKIHPLYL